MIYVTRWALTVGIFALDDTSRQTDVDTNGTIEIARTPEDDGYGHLIDTGSAFLDPGDWARTEEEAREQVKVKAAERAKALRRRVKTLERAAKRMDGIAAGTPVRIRPATESRTLELWGIVR